jgi:ABC-type methionine transport system ATPase subunit
VFHLTWASAFGDWSFQRVIRDVDWGIIRTDPYADISGDSTSITPEGAARCSEVDVTAGSISHRGVDILNPATDRLILRREMTMVAQNPYLFNTTVEDNVAYGLKMRNISKSQMRVTVSRCLAKVGLSSFEKRSARELSGGEIQRVAIARALAICPQVLLLDEPTANVDMQTLSLLEPLLKELNSCSGTSIIMATHDIDQAYRLAHKVFTLQYGRIVNEESSFSRGQKRAANVCILY